MKKFLLSLMLVLLLSISLVTTTAAGAQDNTGCPPGWELHEAHEHDGDHDGHQHLGSDTDRNGDGSICVKHISETKHVHKDNNVPQ